MTGYPLPPSKRPDLWRAFIAAAGQERAAEVCDRIVRERPVPRRLLAAVKR